MKIAWKRFYCTSKKTVTIVFIALLITNTFDNLRGICNKTKDYKERFCHFIKCIYIRHKGECNGFIAYVCYQKSQLHPYTLDLHRAI